jgi:N-terminal domain of galactosyltransferase
MVEAATAGAPGTPGVTVVLPLFGSHRAAETLGAVVRAWLGQDVPCEVVVAIAGGVRVEVDRRAVADGRLRVIRAPASQASPGRLRNVAARAARAPMLYLSDADVIPLGPRYLADAMAMLDGGGRVMVQPWLYRLISGPDWRTVAAWIPPPGKACFVTSDRDGVLTPVPGERFVRADKGLVRLPRGMERDGDPWEQRVLTHHHWGGVLIARRMFDEIGGYCTAYDGWGCEDDDLLVKLQSRWQTVEAWRLGPAISCLHFEHPRPYGGAGLMPNMDILDQRKEMGPEAMIRADVETASLAAG